MLIIVQMYNTLGLTIVPTAGSLRLDTKAQATRRTDTTELLGGCELESKQGKKNGQTD